MITAGRSQHRWEQRPGSAGVIPPPTVLSHLLGGFLCRPPRWFCALPWDLGWERQQRVPLLPLPLSHHPPSQTVVPWGSSCFPWAVPELSGSARGRAAPGSLLFLPWLSFRPRDHSAAAPSLSGGGIILMILLQCRLGGPWGVPRWLRAERAFSRSPHPMDRGAGCASRCLIPGRVPLPVPARPRPRLPHRVPFWFFGWGSQLFGNSDLCRHRLRGHRRVPVVTLLHPTPPSRFPPLAQTGHGYLGPIPPFQPLRNPTAEPRRRFGKRRCREAAASAAQNRAPVTERCPQDNPGAENPKIPGLMGGQTSVSHVSRAGD